MRESQYARTEPLYQQALAMTAKTLGPSILKWPWVLVPPVENHIGAIRYFLCHYNLTGAALLV